MRFNLTLSRPRGSFSPKKCIHESDEYESTESSTKQWRKSSGGEIPSARAASSPEKEQRRKMESFKNLDSGKISISKKWVSDYQERFAEERDTGRDEDLGKLTISNGNRI
ncbi:hypothetical protein U1Q18_039833 [Sarracenia purpurea var. burkii]